MSRASRLGYDGEHPVEVLLTDAGYVVRRPRAGSRRDVGDIGGLPLVVSVKNRDRMELGTWTGDLARLVNNAETATGVVWHKRRGKGSPLDWYVTTTGRLFLPLLDAYVRQETT